MGRKAARLAAKPHVVGSIALDERLRGAGGGPEGPLEFDSGSITKNVFGVTFFFDATFKGGEAPYSAVCVPDAPGFPVNGFNGRVSATGMDPAIDYTLTVTDSAGASVDLRLNVFGFANDETRPLPLPEGAVGPDPEPFPWDAFTTHAQIDGWADAQGVVWGEDWGQMTLASKRQWLAAYYGEDRSWETGN